MDSLKKAMGMAGGKRKRKMNSALKHWVAFVKKVQREEKCSYKDAIHKASMRKKRGAKWRGGDNGVPSGSDDSSSPFSVDDNPSASVSYGDTEGGRRRHSTKKRRASSRRSRTSRRH
jgi:hypothetical protein